MKVRACVSLNLKDKNELRILVWHVLVWFGFAVRNSDNCGALGGGEAAPQMKRTSNMCGHRVARKIEDMCAFVRALPAAQLPALVMAPYGHIDARYGGVKLIARLIAEGSDEGKGGRRSSSSLRVRELCGTSSAEERAAIMSAFMAGEVDVIVTNLSEGYSLSCRRPGPASSAGGGGVFSRGGRPLRQVHVASPCGAPGELDQLKARGNRLHSHSNLPPERRVIEVHHWITATPGDDAAVQRVFGDAEFDTQEDDEASSAKRRRPRAKPTTQADAADTYDVRTLLRAHERRLEMGGVEDAIRRVLASP